MGKRKEPVEPPLDRYIKIRTKQGIEHIARYLRGNEGFVGWYLKDKGMNPSIIPDKLLRVIAFTTSISNNNWHAFHRLEA